MENKCEHEGHWTGGIYKCRKCHRFYATITTHGTKLNNKFGITSVITGWWTFTQTLKNNNNARDRGGYIRTERSCNHGTVI